MYVGRLSQSKALSQFLQPWNVNVSLEFPCLYDSAFCTLASIPDMCGKCSGWLAGLLMWTHSFPSFTQGFYTDQVF